MERLSFKVQILPAQADGRFDPQLLADALRPDTLLVSTMHVNNETGVLQPLTEVADIVSNHDTWWHVDAAQGFGKEFEQLRHPRIDLTSISGHKIYGPEGIGALIVRKHDRQFPPLRPLMFGGGQEQGLRPGTLPVPLIAGLGEAQSLRYETTMSVRRNAGLFGNRLWQRSRHLARRGTAQKIIRCRMCSMCRCQESIRISQSKL